jgi:hypothetical protein
MCLATLEAEESTASAKLEQAMAFAAMSEEVPAASCIARIAEHGVREGGVISTGVGEQPSSGEKLTAVLQQQGVSIESTGTTGSKTTRACIVLYLVGQLKMIRQAKAEAHALTSGGAGSSSS